MEENFKFLSEKLKGLVDLLPDAVLVIDRDGRVVAWNKIIAEMTGVSPEDMIGKGDNEYSIPFYGERVPILIDLVFSPHDEVEKKYKFIKKEKGVLVAERKAFIKGKERYLWGKACLIYDDEKRVIGAIESIRDITRAKKVEEKLKMSETRLLEQKAALEQKNIDLTDILGQVELEKKRLKDNISANVNKVLLPMLKKIKLKGESEKNINILRSGLETLMSSFGVNISRNKEKLTPREIEVANLIKNGLTGKEIARLLNLSFLTVEMHRKNIRHKLGISNKKINLATFLDNL